MKTGKKTKLALDAIGRKISIFWDGEDQWYNGLVTAQNKDGTYKSSSLLQRVRKFDDGPSIPGVDSVLTPSGNASPFSSADMGGGQHSRRPDVVFYSLFGSTVIVYSGTTARILYCVWAILCVGMVWVGRPSQMAPEANYAQNSVVPSNKSQKKIVDATRRKLDTKLTVSPMSYASLVGRSTLHLVFTLLAAITYSNFLAFFMRTLLGRQLTWFAGEWRPVGLYAWPSLIGMSSAESIHTIPSLSLC